MKVDKIGEPLEQIFHVESASSVLLLTKRRVQKWLLINWVAFEEISALDTLQESDIGGERNESEELDGGEMDEEIINVEEVVVEESFPRAESKLCCLVGNMCTGKKTIVGSFAAKCKKLSSAQTGQPLLFMMKEAVKK